ncbi:hypothetical protein HY494_03035 [Candidatus Woesearchaeota archaeon]|nr:hypothetical protein [Candidatus Woesearchaeota archaeon]
MKHNSLCALLALTAGCLPQQQTEITTPIVDISAPSDYNVEIRELFSAKSYQQLSHEILNGLFNNPNSKFNHRHSFEINGFKLVTYYGSFTDQEDKEAIKGALQYFVVDNQADQMIFFVDEPPFGSVDGWYRCFERGKGTLYDTKNTFRCGLMGSKDKEIKDFSLETVELVHRHLQHQSLKINPTYIELFQHLVYKDHGTPLLRGLYSIP